ncbi:MAG: lysophospholipid acyltransferase family protein [Polyangiales bacterium]
MADSERPDLTPVVPANPPSEQHTAAPPSEQYERRPAVRLAQDGPLDRLLSAAAWAAGASWLAPMMGLQMLGHRTLGPDRIQWLERLYTRGQIALTGSRWRAVVDPAIDPHQPYLFFQNHINHLDHCVMYRATPHFKQGVELEAHFKFPIYGAFMRSRGTIPVRPGGLGELRGLKDLMHAEVARGHSLLVFPEGTRTLTGHLGELQSGVFWIAQQIGVPIVPVTVTGMYRVMRKGSLLIRPGHDVTVYCDAPIQPRGHGRRELQRLMNEVRTVMTQRLDAYWQSSSPQRFTRRASSASSA